MMNSFLSEVGRREQEMRDKNVLLGDMAGEFRDLNKFISRNVYQGEKIKR
jgi:hypothetical protein